MKKGKSMNDRRSSTMKVPDYRQYMPAAKRYLEHERKLHEIKAEVKELEKKMYKHSNAMADISFKELGLLGHQVVDDVRKKNADKKVH